MQLTCKRTGSLIYGIYQYIMDVHPVLNIPSQQLFGPSNQSLTHFEKQLIVVNYWLSWWFDNNQSLHSLKKFNRALIYRSNLTTDYTFFLFCTLLFLSWCMYRIRLFYILTTYRLQRVNTRKCEDENITTKD
jgi:hypothetical protein